MALLVALASLTSTSRGSGQPERCREDPNPLRPRLISKGQRSDLLLEWSGTPEGASKGRYRAWAAEVSFQSLGRFSSSLGTCSCLPQLC